jgi:hypothetical protein
MNGVEKVGAMTKFLLLGLCVVLGLVTTLATDGGGDTSKADFKDARVWPLFRCPDDDVRASWTTTPDTPIKILFGGHEISEEGHGDHVLKADIVNHLPPEFEIELKIDSDNAESRKFVVATIIPFSLQDGIGYRIDQDQYLYKVAFASSIWSDDIHVNQIWLESPHVYACVGSNATNHFVWQIEKGTSLSKGLNSSNDFHVSFDGTHDDPRPKLSGEWIVTLRNPSNSAHCNGWKERYETTLFPELRFEIRCE